MSNVRLPHLGSAKTAATAVSSKPQPSWRSIKKTPLAINLTVNTQVYCINNVLQFQIKDNDFLDFLKYEEKKRKFSHTESLE